MKEIQISTPYITLQQSLKLANILSSGGSVKPFLQEEEVFVNGERETRRGRKLYSNDIVKIKNIDEFKITS